MGRNEVYEACKVYIPSLDPMRESGYTKTLLPQEAVDAIIDCAVQEAVKEMWHQLDVMDDKVMRRCGNER